MKKSPLLFLLLCLHPLFGFSTDSPAAKEYTLYQASESKMVKIEAIGEGGYMGDKLQLKLTNLSNEPVHIKIEPGTVFKSTSDYMQDLVVAREELLALQVKGSGSAKLYTFCTQSGNASPSQGEIFTLTSMATAGLLSVVKWISEQKYYNSTAQSAVWAVINKTGLGSVYGEDVEKVKELCQLLESLTGFKCGSDNYKPRAHRLSSISTSFPVLLPDYVEGAKLVAYDANGLELHTYLNNHKLDPGFHHFKFGIHHTQGDSAIFHLRLLDRTGRIVAEKTASMADTIPVLLKMNHETFLSFDVPQTTRGRVGVYDEEGNLYILLGDNKTFPKGFNRVDFSGGRELPRDKKYFFRIVSGDQVVASKEIMMTKEEKKKYAPITKRGVLAFQLKETINKGRLIIVDDTGETIWVVFDDSFVGAGSKRLNYVFQHTQGPDARFFARLVDAAGKVYHESCVVNCK